MNPLRNLFHKADKKTIDKEPTLKVGDVLPVPRQVDPLLTYKEEFNLDWAYPRRGRPSIGPRSNEPFDERRTVEILKIEPNGFKGKGHLAIEWPPYAVVRYTTPTLSDPFKSVDPTECSSGSRLRIPLATLLQFKEFMNSSEFVNSSEEYKYSKSERELKKLAEIDRNRFLKKPLPPPRPN